jgi:dinuclear metal center YbgI/SA1388 family protein
MLLVHHGLFWGQHQQITGAHHARIKTLLDANLNLYACHIPLDAHPDVGNNAELARIAGLEGIAPWGAYKGTTIGMIGNLPVPLAPSALAELFERQLGPARLLQQKPGAQCRRVAICSGLGVSMLNDVLEAGADTLVTGETSHQWHTHVSESEISVIYLGHYASETVGIKAVGTHLATSFGLQTSFIDVPTGL